MNDCVVVDEATFKNHFNVFTNGQLEGWKEWENMVVVGGSVVASLLPIPSLYQNVDPAKYFHDV